MAEAGEPGGDRHRRVHGRDRASPGGLRHSSGAARNRTDRIPAARALAPRARAAPLLRWRCSRTDRRPSRTASGPAAVAPGLQSPICDPALRRRPRFDDPRRGGDRLSSKSLRRLDRSRTCYGTPKCAGVRRDTPERLAGIRSRLLAHVKTISDQTVRDEFETLFKERCNPWHARRQKSPHASTVRRCATDRSLHPGPEREYSGKIYSA